jgi:aminoglycoside 3-N-acetyltransferase
MHAVEEKIIPPYLFGEKVAHELMLSNGKTIKKTYQRHGFKGYEQRYDRLMRLLEPADHQSGKILESNSVVMQATSIWEKGVRYLQQDPFYFVGKVN